MFSFILVSIFIVFFVLVIVLKDQKHINRVAKVFLALFLGGLFIAGGGIIYSGIIEAVQGTMQPAQVLLQIIVGVLFMAFGGIPLYLFFIRREVEMRMLEGRKKKYPDAPWMWADQWASQKIVYSSKGGIRLGFLVLLIMTGGLAAMSYANREKILSGAGESALGVIAFYLIFCSILFIGFLATVRLLRGHLKFGTSTFEMSTYPGIIGGKLSGTIQTHMKEIPETGLELELQCGLMDLTAQSSRDLHADRSISIWETQKKVRREELILRPEGVLIPVSFSIPEGVQESDAWSPRRITWTLSASASFGGVQYLSQFDIPIFRTEASQGSE